jgi:hypothetical protein
MQVQQLWRQDLVFRQLVEVLQQAPRRPGGALLALDIEKVAATENLDRES